MNLPANADTAADTSAEKSSGTPHAEQHTFFATCPAGLQDYLAEEIRRCGAHAVRVRTAGVGFDGSLALAYRVNLSSRLASRVLLFAGGGRFRLDKDLYKRASKIAWEEHLHPHKTLRVDTKGIRVNLPSLKLVSLRVKDAIVDRLREHFDARPNIDTKEPDTRVVVFLEDRDASFYLDLSGENLFKRGWRGSDDKGDAPIKENLAAGLLAASGWPGRDPAAGSSGAVSGDPRTGPLYDPFCGSGTIAIEAAQIAAQLAPGMQREFGLQRLQSFNAEAWAQARAWAANHDNIPAGSSGPAIYASDIDASLISVARANSTRAGLADGKIEFSCQDFLQTRPPGDQPGWLISNVPYGERIAFAGGGDVARRIGAHLRAHYQGWTVCLFSGDLKLPGKLGLRTRRKIPLYNGTIDCRLFIFEINSG